MAHYKAKSTVRIPKPETKELIPVNIENQNLKTQCIATLYPNGSKGGGKGVRSRISDALDETNNCKYRRGGYGSFTYSLTRTRDFYKPHINRKYSRHFGIQRTFSKQQLIGSIHKINGYDYKITG